MNNAPIEDLSFEMKVSILITSHNQIDFLPEAVESALRQSRPPMEIIVSDDCSNDGSQNYILALEDRHPGLVRAFLHDSHMGIPRNKSFAIEAAKGDWIIGLDGDDRLLPRKIECSLDTLTRSPDARLIFGNFIYMDESGVHKQLWVGPDDETPAQGRALKQVFCKAYPGSTLFRNEMVHLESLKKVGFYDPEMTIYEDWELRVRFASQFELAYCPEPLSEYRLHGGGISRIHPAIHAKFIRLVFQKNAHLLGVLSETEKEDVRDKFQQIESTLSKRAAKQYLVKGRLLQSLRVRLDSHKFRLNSLVH